jgi:hypothetical protein
MYKIVVIDSFDSPNANVVKPRTASAAYPRPTPYPNPGVTRTRHQDKREGLTRPNTNHGLQRFQILLLTSGPNPLLSVYQFPAGYPPPLAPWKADNTADGVVMDVSDPIATKRRTGFNDREDEVKYRRDSDSRIQVVLQVGVRKRPYYAKDVSPHMYFNGAASMRPRLDIRERYADLQGIGYTRHPRWIWCPSGIRVSDITTGDDHLHMTAIGCTCTDMLNRGFVHARYGCKHIIAYNKSQQGGELI